MSLNITGQTLSGLATAVLLLTLPAAVADDEVNVYSHRHYEADEVLFKRFTEETGITVNVVKANADELIERLKSEGANSPADLFITADAGRLHRAKAEDLLQEIHSEVVNTAVPERYRDPENQWVGLTMRSRVLIYSPERVKPEELTTYEALAQPAWRGRVVARSSTNIYNQSLLASIIAALGKDEALAWTTAVRGNMARPPQGSDRDQMRAVAAGLADVAIANTYYLGLLASSEDPKDREVAAAIGVFFPNQEGRGAHVNVSGAGLTRSSKNVEAAIKLLEFLVSPEAQATFAEANHEYPVNPEAETSELLKSWGEFKADELPLGKLGELNADAVSTFDLADWQ